MKVILFVLMMAPNGDTQSITKEVNNPKNAKGLCTHWMTKGADDLAANFTKFTAVAEKSCTQEAK